MLTEIRGFCEIAKIDESTLTTYRLYKLVESGADASREFDDTDCEQMAYLLQHQHPLSYIRGQIWAMVSYHDEFVKDHTLQLSQTSWERLRTWITTK